MINELIEQIGGRERLEFIVENAISRERIIMARALLAVLEAQAIGWVDSEEMRAIDKNRHATIYKIEPDNPYHDPRRQKLVYLSPPAASAPEGWKLVPLKAFPSQWAAGQRAFDAAGINKIDPVYRAMVEAAPAPGGDDVKQG